MTGAVRVLAQRTMRRGFETSVRRVMLGVEERVMKQPGLISIETLVDHNDHHKYIVLSQWESEQHYKKWCEEPDYKELVKDLDKILVPPIKTTRIFEKSSDELFLM